MDSIGGNTWLWTGFSLFILTMLGLDLGLFNRKAHAIRYREAWIWSGVWVTLAMIFAAIVFHYQGSQRGYEFLTGYLVELSLSVDNLFVFLLIFGYFRVPAKHRHKALFWGILGALVMRAVFIAAGITLVARFHWIIYLFGVLLVASGVKMALQGNDEIRPERN